MAELEDLDRLAPDVDTDAALAEFRRRRAGRPLPRWPLLVAAAVLVIVAVVGASLLATGDDEPVATGPGAEVPDTTRDVEFTVHAVYESAEDIGTLRSATTPEEYDALLPEGIGPLALIDFDSVVVVSITIPDDACPPELRRFERDGERITPVFVETVTECNEPLIPKTYVVSLPRSQFGDAVELHLPADETYGTDEQFLSVPLEGPSTSSVPVEGPTPAWPPCADIERFADQLVDIGIDYDYTASQSPEEVAQSAELVLSGRLTGGFTSEPDQPHGLTRVGYEIDIDDVYKSPPGANIANPITIHVDIGAVNLADFAPVVVAGIPVVVMAEWLDRADGVRPFADIEGFVTGCPGGPLLGFTGTQGEWADLTDLDDLAARLEALPDDD